MGLSILFGFLVGIVLALPPGPVGVTAIEIGLYQTKKAGFKLALGNAVMDFLYSVSTLFATSIALVFISNFISSFPNIYLIFQISVILIFLVIGYLNIKSNKNRKNEEKPSNNFTSKLGKRGPFLLGIGIALTNLANPTFTPALAGISVWVQEIGLVSDTAISKILFAIGFGLGNLFWVNLIASLANKFKKRISPQVLVRIRQFAGVTFIGFGTILGVRLVAVSKWPEVLRFILAI